MDDTIRAVASTDFTEAHLAAIRSAIAKGELSVAFADRTVTYRSIKELFQAEERIASALSEASERGSKQTYIAVAKGF